MKADTVHAVAYPAVGFTALILGAFVGYQAAPIPPETPPVPPSLARPLPVTDDDGLRYSLLDARVGPVRVVSGGEIVVVEESDELVITILIENRTKNRLLSYDGAQSGGGGALRDDIGNEYRGVRYPKNPITMQQPGEIAIYPGNAIIDVFVFEKPVQSAEFLFFASRDMPAITFPTAFVRAGD